MNILYFRITPHPEHAPTINLPGYEGGDNRVDGNSSGRQVVIHSTYTHPGANAAMLALSRALRRTVLARREVLYPVGDPLTRTLVYIEQNNAWLAVNTARRQLDEINRRFS